MKRTLRLTMTSLAVALSLVAAGWSMHPASAQTASTNTSVAPLTTPSSVHNPIQVNTIDGPTVTELVKTHIHTSWPWYVVRGSGIVAAVCLVLLLLSGVGQITGFTYKVWPPLTAWATHRSLGIVGTVAMLLHIGALLFDHFLPFSIPQLLIPWLSSYKPVTIAGIHLGSLYVALGILAFYLMLAVTITSLLWVEKKPHTWKLIHFLAYVVIALVFVHALQLGTDLSHGWLKVLWWASGVTILVTSLQRLWRAHTA